MTASLLGCSYTPPPLSEQLRIAERNLDHAQIVYALSQTEVATCWPVCLGATIGAKVNAELAVERYAARVSELEEKE